MLDPTIPRILIDADGYIESADFVAGTSGFQINGGTAEFNDVVIRGTIYASVGVIGGWTITATQLKAAGDVILLDSGGVITVGGAGYLQSDPFTSGTRGWRITPTEAEFENIVARGEIRTAVFRHNEVHAQAGQLLVTPNAAKLDEDLTIAASGAFNVGELGRFAGGDIVRLKDGTGDVWLTVVADIGAGYYSYTRSSGSPAGTVFRAGTAVVGYGTSGEGGIVLDAVSANGPFMDIFTHAGAPWTILTTKVRVGNLAGIVDTALNPTGYGFYSDNAYLRGDLLAGGGKVLIDSLGIHIDIEGATPTAGRIIFEDFDGDYNFWAMMWTYPDSPAYRFYLRNRAASATYTTATTLLSAEGAAATAETVSDVFLSAPTGWSGLRAAAGTYAVVGVWDGAATVVRPKTTWNGGGDIVHKLFDSAGATKIAIQDGAEVEVAYVNSDGKVLCVLDAHPDSDAMGFFRRMVNVLGVSTYDDHFRAGVIPSGYAWQGAPLGGTPATALNYSYLGEMLRYGPAASTRYFLSRAVTNAGANWQNKSLYGRFNARLNGRHGLRFDDGTDNNYVQVYVTGEADDGTASVSFQYRAGGGGVTTCPSAINVPACESLVLMLRMVYSAPNYTGAGYLVGEDGQAVNITGFSVAVAWAPAAGRAGLFGENPSASAANPVECDWFKNEFV